MTTPLTADAGQSFAIRLMQHLVVPTFVLDAGRRVLIWNRACERLTGMPASEVIGTRLHWRAFYPHERHCLADLLALGRAEALASLYAAHSEPGESGHGLRAENWCEMPRTGKRLYLAIDAGPIYDEEGRLIAVVETLRDMTEQKEAQLALQTLATRDGLTGIANRRSFDERLSEEWLRAQRDHQPISLILADVDYFKPYNDRYGHQQGDECLRRVAGTLAASVFRPADLPARYGGEEFAVIMPNTDARGARAVAERIRHGLHAARLPHAASAITDHVTASLGVASLVPEAGRASDELVAAADAALYGAKHGGRDRIVVHAGSEAAEAA